MTNVWDLTIATMQIILIVSLLPIMIKKKSFVPRLSSSITAVAMYIIAFAFFNLEIYFSFAAAFVSGLVWTVIFIYRGDSKRR